MEFSADSLPHRNPMPVGPHILCPDAATKSTPRAWTSTLMCGTDWQASSMTFAPGAARERTIFTMDSMGLMFPKTLETCCVLTNFVFGPINSLKASRSNAPVTEHAGTYFSTAPVRSAAICQGTMFEWCSASVITISSPSWRYNSRAFDGAFPHVCDREDATRLIASVAPLVNTISFRLWALTKDATLSRAASYCSVASRDRA
mmetsp:Transcript_34120/g.72685  ORF Transcript_34120/g.72685 Transcript_34120/m.72685 type:complete len:203 (+) Transcript_34120:698-1306(+)